MLYYVLCTLMFSIVLCSFSSFSEVLVITCEIGGGL